MTDALRIYVGSDMRMGVAERALKRSAEANSSIPLEWHWMRADDHDQPAWRDWEIGRKHGRPYSRQGWATDFTCFRYMVPELAGFEGLALYLDVDMVVLGDLRELAECAFTHPWMSAGGRCDVVMFDCAKFDGVWPVLEEAKASGWQRRDYMRRAPLWGTLPDEWDCLDKLTPGRTKLLHFTNMRTQPWEPWPEAFGKGYGKNHRDPAAVECFWRWADDGVA